ncbi:MAG: tyrosine--tRNA ligase [Alphaproteobacteria bacterium]|nr:tyrosine--tRNA ligase [Alphaproteobacteria bacterium]
MQQPKSEFLRVLTARGYVHQCTDMDGLDRLASDGTLIAYEGFDCTAPSLHVGNLVGIMVLRHLQRAGYRPIVLMGGGTTKVGDPSGKEESRQILSEAEIAANMAGIKQVFARFLEFGDGPTDALMVNNADWLDPLEYIPFLREFGPHFSVNRMLAMDSVKLRLDRQQPLSFLEFNYMVLQAYDFLELARRYDCVLQIGGSDQWGNIVNGVELGRRVDNRTLYGLTSPLLTTSSGTKMGKTADGAVWLNERMLSAYDYWQFWRNADDADVGRFLRLFTELPLDEIERLERLQGDEINETKKILANEVTSLCHGPEASQMAAETARNTFEGSGVSENLQGIDVPRAELNEGVAAFELLHRAGLCSSRGEARRLIKGGGGRVNDIVIGDEAQLITLDHLGAEGLIKLSAGKKRHARVKPT